MSTASPLGAPTFVGWRDQPLPSVGPARTFQLCQVLRELGFARHATAVMASDMSPLADARKEIEAASNTLHAADFNVLVEDERDEFRTLAKAALTYASPKLTPSTRAALPKD
ncbi:MAG: hypothetical protein ACKV2O_09395 [Acidimicrobiales bacterium]